MNRVVSMMVGTAYLSYRVALRTSAMLFTYQCRVSIDRQRVTVRVGRTSRLDVVSMRLHGKL
jgi:hypothetical protein